MSENFENELRRALRPIDAPDGFAERVMRALPAQRDREPLPAPEALPTRRLVRRFAVPAAFAAALVVSMLLGQHVADVQRQRTEQQAGLAASRELMEALKVTSQKLDLAYQAVKTPPPPAGDEENRT
ncbi:MAG TPA: hypothetical protein VMF52_10165 [Steroidobacteraceae bacterium]|nr:hypothetical protein [Steroidobacteraceae bacterium]